ncbi:MAG TPA: mucoidy inhibitor MuiA family protein [Anaeromyxobacteraceae bacterium]|nr:mucoidy inhibitor MuiA family protein [Anaeromyxobacteraceae bacterium]
MRLPALALLVSLPSAVLAAPVDLPAVSRVDAVTVHASSARVTRVARVELPSGDARVLLAGLPRTLDDDSIRVSGRGAARARVLSVAVEPVSHEAAVSAEARAAEEKLLALQDEDRTLEDRLRAAQARAKFVESLRSTYAEERTKNLAVRPVSAKEWAALAAFVDAELAAAAAEARKVEVARRALGRRIDAARAELAKLQAKRADVTKTVAVDVAAERAGTLELEVTYAVPQAGWEPAWDARLVPEQAQVELALVASVWQRTGEDWTDVRLSVSTARPERPLFVPELEPLALARAHPEPVALRRAAKSERQAAEAPAAAPAPDADLGAGEVLEVASASVETGAAATTFTAPRRERIDGAGRARKVPLARFPLKAAIARTAAPRQAPVAFLTAKATNETGIPLLPGAVGVWVGDDFVGRTTLPFTPAGGELELAFGADDRVEVERRVVERRRESAGLLGGDEVYRYRIRTTLENRWSSPTTVNLLDLVPVSADESIAVKLLDGTTGGAATDPDRPGVRRWEVALGAREKQVVELRYEVRFPRGLAVGGLE